MVTYDKETRTLVVTEHISWEHYVRPILEEACADADIPVPELSDADIHDIMEEVKQEYEFDIECMARCGGEEQVIETCVDKVVQDRVAELEDE